jgi:hypothetical protein
MSPRSHLSLRIGAVVLLACAAIWPRARARTNADELSRASRGSVAVQTTAARAETAAARLVSAPDSAKLVVTVADEPRITN